MPHPPSKKAKSATEIANENPLGPILDLIESDSDEDPEPVIVHAENEDGDTDSSDSNSEEIVPNAPLSPPPTVMKRKRGRKAKVVEEISRSYFLVLFFTLAALHS
jgi:hypothetical protein